MVIELQTILKIAGGIAMLLLFLFIVIKGFSENSKMHGKNKNNSGGSSSGGISGKGEK